MAFNKTWNFSLNQPVMDSSSNNNVTASFLIQLVAFLIANGWTVTFCSNGVTTSTTNNLWLALSDIVFATSGGYSHITLASPVGLMPGLAGDYLGTQSQGWLTFKCNNSNSTGANKIYLDIVQHITAPTGGTVSVAPTSTKQQLNSSTKQIQNSGVTGTPSFHFAATPQGQFWAGISYSGTNILGLFMAVLPFETVTVMKATNKPYPYTFMFVSFYSYSTSNVASQMLSANYGFTNNGNPTSSPIYLKFMDIGNNQATGDINGDYIYSPIYAECIDSGQAIVLGKIADFEFRSVGVNNNGSSDALSNITRAYFGQMALPANAVLNH